MRVPGASLSTSGLTIKVNGNFQQPYTGRNFNALKPSGIKVWVSLPGKGPTPAEVFCRGKGNMK